MTEKDRMIEIIAPHVSAWGDDEAIAEALIAAGFGDVKEAKRKAFVYNREITHLDGILKGAERRAEVAEKEFKKTEHRAEVAEKMFNILYEETSEYMKVLSKEWYKYQAEKELEEEKKNGK